MLIKKYFDNICNNPLEYNKHFHPKHPKAIIKNERKDKKEWNSTICLIEIENLSVKREKSYSKRNDDYFYGI